MKTTMIAMIVTGIGSSIAAVLCFKFCEGPGIAGIFFVVTLICFLVLYVTVMNYTNLYHDENSDQTLSLSKASRKFQDNYDCIQTAPGIFELRYNGSIITLNLIGYPFKKAFITAVLIRFINYIAFQSKEYIIDFFKRRNITHKIKKDQITLSFLSPHKKRKTYIVKRGKTRFGPIVKLVLYSKYKMLFLSNNYYFTHKKDLVRYNEVWFLRGDITSKDYLHYGKLK